MTYTNPYVYLRAQGFFNTAAAPKEQWSVGFKLLQPGTNVPTASLIAFLETVSGPFATFHGSTGWKAGSTAVLSELNCAVIGTDGKYVGGGAQSTIRRPYGTPVTGNSSAIHNWSTALVISLRTTLQRGRASNGRAYWPALAMTVDSTTGGLTSSNTASAAGVAATLINAINQAADAHIEENQGVWVMSNIGSGTSAPVTSIRVGSKLDSMETREKSIVEQYSSAAINSVPVVRAKLRDTFFGETLSITPDD